MLLDGKDVKVKLAVLYLMTELKDRRYLPMARKFMNHPKALKEITSLSLNWNTSWKL